MAVATLDHGRIVAFALEHGTSAAARRFRISDSYVRRLKREVSPAPVSAPARPGLRVVDAPSVPVSRVSTLQLAPANMVASRGAMWRCAVCHELVSVAAGTVWNDWIKRSKCLHGTSAAVATPARVPAVAPVTPDSIVPVLDTVSTASQSTITAVPVAVLGSATDSDDAGVMSLATAPAAGPSRLSVVMSFMLPWLAEYWRVPLAVALGLVIICMCAAGVR